MHAPAPVQPVDDASLDAHGGPLRAVGVPDPVHHAHAARLAEVAVHAPPFLGRPGPKPQLLPEAGRGREREHAVGGEHGGRTERGGGLFSRGEEGGGSTGHATTEPAGRRCCPLAGGPTYLSLASGAVAVVDRERSGLRYVEVDTFALADDSHRCLVPLA